MYFSRLRLAGFKSFVEPTDLSIETGLTGVVGPNGCGKSNLVEALRWVMGETSARQMRGSEMDDMIFGGTVGRPARNLAEVTLSVDNGQRRAPAAFNDHAELEVTRRIDRGKGSVYRVNGREVRARDVQLLFADAATGARSPSLVSQGQIGKLINAPPGERRILLEDAAGISGLHARRHEAELRLKAAETNLERLEDILETLDRQLEGLKRQADQAAHYRLLTERLRAQEACLLAARWQAGIEAQALAADKLEAARVAVAQAAERAVLAAAVQAQAYARLPDLRRAEAEAAATLQKAELELAGLDAEEQRIEHARRSIENQRWQIDRDLEREGQIAGDAETALERLDDEAQALSRERMDEELAQEEAGERLAAAAAAAEAAEQGASERAEAIAFDEATRAELNKRLTELEQRNLRLSAELEEIAMQRDDQAAKLAESGGDEDDEIALAEAEMRVETAGRVLEEADEKRQSAALALEAAERILRDSQGRLARIQGEIDGVTASLAPERNSQPALAGEALLDRMTVAPGYEAAAGALLGDDLMAPLQTGDGTGKAAYWRDLPEIAGAPPAQTMPLAAEMRSPPALRRRLAVTGLAKDLAQALSLQAELQPGQRLVTAAGDLVRWDGFVQPAGAPGLAATRLALRNRLAALEAERSQLIAEGERLAAHKEQARYAANAAQSFEHMARTAERQAVGSLAQLREDAIKRRAIAERARNRLSGLEQTIERLARDCTENDRATAETLDHLGRLADPAQARSALAAARAVLAAKRAAAGAARAERDRLQREAEQRAQRLAAIARERQDWRQRAAAAQSRLEDLAERQLAAAAELAALASLPERFASRRDLLLTQLAALRQARRQAADRLAEGEEQLRVSDRALRAGEAEAAAKRETLVRAQGLAETAARDAATLAERIRERLDCRPEQARTLTGLALDAPLPDPTQSQEQLDKLNRERDAMGPVNLRAESEVEELENRIGSMVSEREDLLAAIQRLRSGILALNREGRERLMVSFEQVKRHFEDLFVRLFDGGKAQLELTGNDDPLMAGLEIMASPPGKTPKTMSLLSGGESALTALALIFAVFLTNPSPICVLDEVDAPLDDANVDRFCRLLEGIASETGTRFLVVTHHRMTMARMDRLFGVTMVERGISQLVSVDLNRAEKLAGRPRAA